MIGKSSSDNNKISNKNSLILILGILNGKLDEIIYLLTELNRKTKKTNPPKSSNETTTVDG